MIKRASLFWENQENLPNFGKKINQKGIPIFKNIKKHPSIFVCPKYCYLLPPTPTLPPTPATSSLLKLEDSSPPHPLRLSPSSRAVCVPLHLRRTNLSILNDKEGTIANDCKSLDATSICLG